MGRLISIQQVVPVKSFNKNASNAANLAKTLTLDEMSRNPFFLFSFGIAHPDKLLLECVFRETLREILSNDLGYFSSWKTACTDIVRGISSCM